MGDWVVFNVKLLLRPGEDDDLIEVLERAPSRKRAAMVKGLMRFGVDEQSELVVSEDRELTLSLEGFLQ